MTPLLHKIMNDLCLPKRKRRLQYVDTNPAEMTKLLDGVHSFDCTGIRQLAFDLASRVLDGDGIDVTSRKTTTFLPAARTWIEYRTPDKTHEAMLLIDDERTNQTAQCIWLISDEDWIGISEKHGTLNLDTDALGVVPILSSKSDLEQGQVMAIGDPRIVELMPDVIERGIHGKMFITAEVYALLGMINTPRIFQRLIHQPHAGLQRKLMAAQPLIGTFPVGAWTEILLKVPAPPTGPQSVSTGGYLTGERALHWCRAHLRYRLGQWEVVSDHWRGNPAIGIKRSRYRLESTYPVT